MLLNKLPCLDKGYVAYLDSSLGSELARNISIEFLKTTDCSSLLDSATLTLLIKCPLFVQLNISLYDLKIKSFPPKDGVEAYVPNVGDIASNDHGAAVLMSKSMEETTAALLMNPKAYQVDGCNRFVSQVLMPISTYTTLMVHGPYNEWKRFCDQNNAPAVLSSYIAAIQQVIKMEWKDV